MILAVYTYEVHDFVLGGAVGKGIRLLSSLVKKLCPKSPNCRKLFLGAPGISFKQNPERPQYNHGLIQAPIKGRNRLIGFSLSGKTFSFFFIPNSRN
jgi:hypothetical protein